MIGMGTIAKGAQKKMQAARSASVVLVVLLSRAVGAG